MTAATIEFDTETIRRFDRNGPRYTSYPTADRFQPSFGSAAYRRAAERRNTGGVHRPLSLYVHLPFCRHLCFYCACNKVVTRDVSKAERYLGYLEREMTLQAPMFSSDPRVIQMHWGGGTPTYYDMKHIRSLYGKIASHFELSPTGEYSIEIDPRTVEPGAIAELRDIGFNRASFGVQDFDPDVQKAVHRLQSEESTLSSIAAARKAGFQSINIDLIYGLPRQSLPGFAATLDRVTGTRPDRVALYSYAHLPSLFMPQTRIREEELPSPELKLELMAMAIERLGAAGYVYIGMDHFALPQDPLAVAQRQGRLHRNFQGYSTCAETDLVGLGVTSIGALGPTYSQNRRTLAEYYDSLDRGELPIFRGIELNADDLIRRSVIQALMCHFTLSKSSIEVAYLIDFDRYFASELQALRELAALDLVETDEDWVTVTPKGRFVIRGIAMTFDRYLRDGSGDRRYSRVV